MKKYIIKSCRYPFKLSIVRQERDSLSSLEETLAKRFGLKLSYFELKRDSIHRDNINGYYFGDHVINLIEDRESFS